MATAQKLYTVEFMLNAMLNSGFTAAFSQAQQKFTDLGNEIKGLQAVQSDISAYEKQQQAVQNTTEKLTNLRSQEELLTKQLDEAKASSEGNTAAVENMTRETAALERQISSAEQTLSKQQQTAGNTAQKLDELRTKEEGLTKQIEAEKTANGENSTAVAKLEKQKEKLEQRIASTEQTLEKQNQKITETETNINNLRTQEEALTRQIEAEKAANVDNTAAVAALEREKLKLEQQIANTEQALDKQNQKLSETGQRLAEAGIGTQTLVAEFQREQQALQDITGRIDSYKSKIEALDGKLRDNAQEHNYLQRQMQDLQTLMTTASSQGLPLLEEQYKKLEQELNKNSAEASRLTQEKQKLEQQVSNIEQALEKQNQKLQESEQRLKDAGVDTQNLTAADADLSTASSDLAEKIAKLKEEQRAAKEEAEQLERAQRENEETARETAAAMTVLTEATGEMKDAFMTCITVAMDFEQAMSAVEAIANATADELDALTEKAKETGAETKFTAQESAEAMEYMAMAGWKAEDMLSGLDGVVNLAAAAGEDLATTSDIVTDDLTAFGLTASDTAHFADVLAQAAANSNTNVSIMGETFKSSAAIAGALGYTIEDVAIATGLMANAGVKGSRASTALRNIFNGFLKGGTLVSDAFGEMEFSAIKADGTLKSFSESINELRYYFNQMSEAEKVTNANSLVGMRGYNGLLAIVNSTTEDYNALTDAINNCDGAAEKMKDIRLDNLAGDVALAESAFEALKNSWGEDFIPVARTVVETVTDVVTWLNEFVKDNPGVVAAVTTFAGSFLTLVTAVTAVNTGLKLLTTLATAIGGGGVVGVIAAVASGIGLVTGAVTAYTSEMTEGVTSVDDLTGSLQRLETKMEEASDAYEDTETNLDATAETAKMYINRLREIEDELEENASQSTEYKNILSLLKDLMPELADSIDETTGSIEGGTAALAKSVDTLTQNAKEQAYQEYLDSYESAYNDAVVEQTSNQLKLTEATTKLNAAEEKRKKALEEIQNLPQEELMSEGDDYKYWCGQLDEANAEIRAQKQNIDNLNEALDESGATLEKASAELADARASIAALQTEQDSFDTTNFEQALMQAGEAYATMHDTVQAAFDGMFTIFSQAEIDEEKTVDAATTALNSQLTFWQSYNENISYLRTKSAEDLGVTQEQYDLFFDYIETQAASGDESAMSLISDMTTQLENGNTNAVTAMITMNANVQEERNKAVTETTDWITGLQEQLDDLMTYMQDTVDGMDLSTESAEYARSTMEAYIRECQSGAATAESVIDDMIAKIKQKLSGSNISVQSGAGVQITHSSASSAYGGSVPNGWATGTEDAPPGWAWVGEQGPELVNFQGGETVLPAPVSQEFAEAYNSYNNSYSSYTTNGNPVEQGPELVNFQGGETVLPAFQQAYSILSPVQAVSSVSEQRKPISVDVSGTQSASGAATFGDVNITLNVPNSVSSIPDLERWLRTSGKGAVVDIMRNAERDARRTRL